MAVILITSAEPLHLVSPRTLRENDLTDDEMVIWGGVAFHS